MIFFLLIQTLVGLAKPNQVPALIPMPQKVTWNGQIFKVIGNEAPIITRIVPNLPEVPIHSDEAYILKVNRDSVVLLARTQMGLFRGRQTIRQLTFTKKGHQFLAGCSITDWPAFEIRGFMQDVGRNFMSMSLLKEQIDVMAAYKFNVFHFHVTDNPGWRLESKKYPELNATTSMSRWPGKFYTQKDFVELVNYCNDRFITLIPELDVPGHSAAFRKAFAIDSMSDRRVQPIFSDLIDELCALVPEGKMPYIHLGTDEVRTKQELAGDGLLDAVLERVKYNKREVIVWRPGQQIDSDKTSISQLWSSKGEPNPGHRYIDSRLNYLNHSDPLAVVPQFYFTQICNASAGDSQRMGGILCCWNDNNVPDEYNILRQNPVYPGMLAYSETSWRGQSTDLGDKFLAKLPARDSKQFMDFQDFEERLIQHRNLYFQGKPFPYVKQTQINWQIIGPFNNKGDVNERFPVENSDEQSYTIEGKTFKWTGPYIGGTIHLKHFLGFPSYFSEKQGTVYARTKIWSPKNQVVGFWIGFQDWSRSGGRRGGPFPEQGQWHTTNPKIWVNQIEIEPPVWNNPGLTEKTEEIPFSDENYFFRNPTSVTLIKGWNKVLLKVPQGGKSWKWMFTFLPVKSEGQNVREVDGLEFSSEIIQ